MLFSASAQAAGEGRRADVAVDKWETSLNGPDIHKACELSDIVDGEQLSPSGELEDLLKVVSVCRMFHILTSYLKRKHRHTLLCMAASRAYPPALASSLLLGWLYVLTDVKE